MSGKKFIYPYLYILCTLSDLLYAAYSMRQRTLKTAEIGQSQQGLMPQQQAIKLKHQYRNRANPLRIHSSLILHVLLEISLHRDIYAYRSGFQARRGNFVLSTRNSGDDDIAHCQGGRRGKIGHGRKIGVGAKDLGRGDVERKDESGFIG